MANNQVAIFQRLIAPDQDSLSPDAARFFLSMQFREEDHVRMEELAAKSSEGSLTPEERTELEDYVRAGHLLAMFQAKARASLERHGHAA